MPVNISTIHINAPVEQVWNTITQPALVKLWQYGSDLHTDWQPGSPIRFRTEWEGKVFEQWGEVLEVIPYQLVRYNLFAPRPGLDDTSENYFIMQYMLTEEGTKTRLEITQEDNRPHAVQEEPQGEENPVLQALKKVAEEG